MRKPSALPSAVRLAATAALVLALPLLFAACFQMRMDTNLRPDGGGTFEVDYAISQTVADAVKELQEIQGQQPPSPMLAGFERAEIEASARRHGVEVQSFAHETVDGRERFRMRLGFRDLASLSALLGSEGGGGLALYRLPDGNLQLVSTSGPEGGAVAGGAEEGESTADPEPEAEAGDDAADEWPAGDEADDAPADAAPADPAAAQQELARSMELMGTMMSALSELRIEMRITVPGDVVRHNAHRVEGRTLIWEVDGENAMSMGEVVPEVVFSGKGLQIDAPAPPR